MTAWNKLTRTQIAELVARDIPDGAYVNLGIGMPTLLAQHLPADREIILHSENGILGMTNAPEGGHTIPTSSTPARNLWASCRAHLSRST
jgi:acyl CoA:acetate/3-ketoacid CoA transferase beta subunit